MGAHETGAAHAQALAQGQGRRADCVALSTRSVRAADRREAPQGVVALFQARVSSEDAGALPDGEAAAAGSEAAGCASDAAGASAGAGAVAGAASDACGVAGADAGASTAAGEGAGALSLPQ